MTRTHHAPHEVLARHQHAHGFAAVVLAGRYSEAGDTGFHRVESGDVLIHHAFESHLDRFEAAGGEVLVIPLTHAWTGPLLGRVRDADEVVRAAERDAPAAATVLAGEMFARPSEPQDWPDLLAREMRDDPALALGSWASARGLHRGSISRGFRQVFGVTPVHFRLVARTHLAIRALRDTHAGLADIAHACGFADQAHLARAVRAVCATSPARLRTAD
jgi:AraC-like DNA-binding protein